MPRDIETREPLPVTTPEQTSARRPNLEALLFRVTPRLPRRFMGANNSKRDAPAVFPARWPVALFPDFPDVFLEF